MTANFAANTPLNLILRPTGAGAETALSRQGDTSNWACVDETQTNGDGTTTYVYDSSEGNYNTDTYATADHTAESGTINSVTVFVRAERTGSDTTNYARAIIRIGSTDYYGSVTNTLTTSWADYSVPFPTNPSGGSWGTNWSTIDSLQIGVSLQSSDTSGGGQSYAYCTQIWAVVNYTPA